jgi:hypothetical protein
VVGDKNKGGLKKKFDCLAPETQMILRKSSAQRSADREIT